MPNCPIHRREFPIFGGCPVCNDDERKDARDVERQRERDKRDAERDAALERQRQDDDERREREEERRHREEREWLEQQADARAEEAARLQEAEWERREIEQARLQEVREHRVLEIERYEQAAIYAARRAGLPEFDERFQQHWVRLNDDLPNLVAREAAYAAADQAQQAKLEALQAQVVATNQALDAAIREIDNEAVQGLDTGNLMVRPERIGNRWREVQDWHTALLQHAPFAWHLGAAPVEHTARYAEFLWHFARFTASGAWGRPTSPSGVLLGVWLCASASALGFLLTMGLFLASWRSDWSLPLLVASVGMLLLSAAVACLGTLLWVKEREARQTEGEVFLNTATQWLHNVAAWISVDPRAFLEDMSVAMDTSARAALIGRFGLQCSETLRTRIRAAYNQDRGAVSRASTAVTLRSLEQVGAEVENKRRALAEEYGISGVRRLIKEHTQMSHEVERVGRQIIEGIRLPGRKVRVFWCPACAGPGGEVNVQSGESRKCLYCGVTSPAL